LELEGVDAIHSGRMLLRRNHIRRFVMKGKALLTGIFAVVMIMFFCLSLTYAAPATIRFSSGAPENHFLTKQYIEWAKLVEKISKGDIKVQVYHSAQLYRDNEIIKAVQTGGVESGCAFTLYLESQLVPAMKVYQMPYLFQNLDETWKVYKSEVGAAWKQTAEKKGVKLLAIVTMPAPEDHIVLTTKPVKVPADIKGLVIRGATPEHAIVIKKWGAGPSFLTGAEVYLGLQRNTINGAINSLATYMDRKLYEAAPYAVMTPLSVVHTFIIMNKNYFEKLTPEQQKVILEASATIENNTVQVSKNTLKEDLEAAKKKAKIYVPNAAEAAQWREGVSGLWDEITKGNKETVDALKKVREMLKR
jgi:TRAP-type C4-dicarboxylate transport system substrate-binding protein